MSDTYQLLSYGLALIAFMVLVYKLIKGDIKFDGNNKPYSYGISDDFTVFIIIIIFTGVGLWPLFLLMLVYYYFKDKLTSKKI